MTEQIKNLPTNVPEYVKLVSHISASCENAKKAVYAVYSEVFDANWQTGQNHTY